MGQLVGNELFALAGLRLIRAFTEKDILACGEGLRAQFPGKLIGFGISVDSYLAEVMPQIGLQ
jgi:hypothetical protein